MSQCKPKTNFTPTTIKIKRLKLGLWFSGNDCGIVVVKYLDV